MPTSQTNLLARDDTFLGVCEALGEDLRIHANLFRVAFAGLLFWNPVAAIGTYFGLGAVVALSRWLYPNPAVAAVEPATERDPSDGHDVVQETMPLAA